MRILHIWNTAGVASILAKFMDRLYNTRSLVITRKLFDPFGVTTYGETWNCGALLFKVKTLIKARRFDIIHVHAVDRIVPRLKALYKKPIILHYHGSDIRGKWRERKKYWKFADIILVSTEDLLENAPPDVIYLPNPVDIDIFFKFSRYRRDRSALYIVKHQEGESVEWAEETARTYNLNLYIHDRVLQPIPYLKLPIVLNLFEYYIDHNYIRSLSKTALEALACGCRVIRWDRKNH